jgi:hypothetical protein
MNFKKLELTDKPLIDDRLKNINTSIAEYTFANLFLFRGYHDYRIGIIDNILLVKGTSYDSKTYYMPIESPNNLKSDFLIKILKDVDFIFPIDESWLSLFEKELFDYEYKEGDTDYIYTVEKISTYKGRKLHKKRNLLKQFKELYSCYSYRLLDENIEDAKQILELWMSDIGLDKDETDYYPCIQALELKKELGLCGVIYYIEENPVGFVLGEGLNNDTFVLHFAKGLRFYKGIYQYIYNSFAKKLPKTYKYINFEQDLGKVALRVAKSSYIPDILNKKYRIFLKD